MIRCGVRRVVAAMGDPNPLVGGEGFRRLAAAGIAVDVGLLEQEALLCNRAFVTRMTMRRPFVTLKLAQSLDGKAATHTGHSKWITSEESRRHAHLIRSQVDAIAVGIGTALADDPLLTARSDEGTGRQPMRVIVDSHARLPVSAQCLAQPGGETWVAVSGRAPEQRIRRLESAGAKVWMSPGDGARVDLEALLEHLAAQDVTHLLVEGGPTLRGSFRRRRPRRRGACLHRSPFDRRRRRSRLPRGDRATRTHHGAGADRYGVGKARPRSLPLRPQAPPLPGRSIHHL